MSPRHNQLEALQKLDLRAYGSRKRKLADRGDEDEDDEYAENKAEEDSEEQRDAGEEHGMLGEVEVGEKDDAPRRRRVDWLDLYPDLQLAKSMDLALPFHGLALPETHQGGGQRARYTVRYPVPYQSVNKKESCTKIDRSRGLQLPLTRITSMSNALKCSNKSQSNIFSTCI